MSGRARSATPVIRREYAPEPDACIRALELLLKKPVSAEGSPALATLEDTREESENVSRAETIIPN
jgi:hypothetical protein